MIVGTAGHIDHGKSSLVQALTGICTDRLQEEQERGMSIELGFAHWKRPFGCISFVDVPGHEKLVRTMLAGATGFDFLLLVVAADDGPMPQTKEHVAIADLLGLDRGVVALTKIDVVSSARQQEAAAEIRQVLADTALARFPSIPVSTVTGEGLAEIQNELDAAGAVARNWDVECGFRMGVDRVFSRPGAGTVATGTVIAGQIYDGEKLIVSPAGLHARVRSLHASNNAAKCVRAGERCAIALTGPDISHKSVARGAVLVAPFLHSPTQRIDVRTRFLNSVVKPLSAWTPVRLHHGAAEVTAHLVPLFSQKIGAEQTGYAQLVLDAPLAACVGDRFVLRDISAMRTIGGGEILDIDPPARRRHSPARLQILKRIATLPHLDAMRAHLDLAGNWLDVGRWFSDRGLTFIDRECLVEELQLFYVALPGGRSAAVSNETLERMRSEIRNLLEAFHVQSPDRPGLPREEVRRAVAPRMPKEIFLAIVQALVKAQAIGNKRGGLSLPGFEQTLSPEEEDLLARLDPLISRDNRFRPPRVRELATVTEIPEPTVRRILRIAVGRGDVDEVAKDRFLKAQTIDEIIKIAKKLSHHAKGNGFTVAEFRDELQNTRRVAVEILEFLGAHGYTVRKGDFHRINPRQPDA